MEFIDQVSGSLGRPKFLKKYDYQNRLLSPLSPLTVVVPLVASYLILTRDRVLQTVLDSSGATRRVRMFRRSATPLEP